MYRFTVKSLDFLEREAIIRVFLVNNRGIAPTGHVADQKKGRIEGFLYLDDECGFYLVKL